ncbi:hypothetical protein JTE90_012860 [Oedothorax gibbosus]|uniref:Phospholipase A2-like central domain-containing protein n=1 Tax=Oedothorax gibbosus TaxID=931172 RepID=A0AAV6UP26_9ARAC|nr:hypothetical protein JTE90_012860 [Oedothorax gibbosus]
MHDLCYEKAGDSVCYDEKPHVAPYRWKYSNGKIYCSKAGHACGLVTCRCDAKFTGCIDVYKDTYNPQLRKVRPPLYNAINRFLSQINKKARIDRIEAPFISIKLRRSSEYF